MNFSMLSQNTFLVALIITAVSWLLNENSKRRHEDYIRKEQRYGSLLKSLKGFYEQSQNKELKEEFINQVNQCWLYCPDEVIQKAYFFLKTVHTGANTSNTDKETALGELILAIRKDLYTHYPFRRTKLKPEDFKHLRST